MPDEAVDVLIAGGSLVGMSTAMLLGCHGVRPMVVERHPGAAIHPRAAALLQRSMEVLRAAGIEDEVVRRSVEQFEPDGAIVSVETLAGREIARHMERFNLGVEDMSPCERLFVTQIALEPVMRERAEALGADVRFRTEVGEVEQDADGVTATIRDLNTGDESTVRARYLVAADGPRSPVRRRLGIGMRGRGVMSKAVTIYFRAEVGHLLRERNLSVVLVNNDEFRGFFRLEKPYRSAFLVVHTIGDPDAPVTDVWDLGDDRCADLVRAGLGADVDVEIEDVMRWEAVADVAERMCDGRIFLAGDAAHTMPPYGGYGGNTGIHDAHNLAWKLAAVLDGSAGEALLDTYEVERGPAAEFTVEQAYARYVTRAAPDLAAKGFAPIVGDLEIDLGIVHRSAAVAAEGEDEGPVAENPRESSGRPGRRAPHVPLERDGRPISSLDLFGAGLVLLTGSDGAAWAEAAERASARTGVALQVHRVGNGGPIADPEGAFPAAYGISPSGASLVRPDGIVAWRAVAGGGACADALGDVLERILGRQS